MKRLPLLLLVLLVSLSGIAQQYIGCRGDDGWAMTPMLRKSFVVKASDLKHYDYQTTTFTVTVNSLGYHELFINGTKVGNEVLQPAVSQLNKRSLKVSYDITPYVRKGQNEILLWLGQGWGRIYGTPAVAQAEVYRTVSDKECGIERTLASTDDSWEASPSGYSYTSSWLPLQFGGERYDARVKPHWLPATAFQPNEMTVSWQEFEGNHIIDTLSDLLPEVGASGQGMRLAH